MARLPRRSSYTPMPASLENPGAGRSGGANRAVTRDESVPLNTAVEAMLAAGGVDPVTRIRLTAAQQAIGEPDTKQDAEGLGGIPLTHTLFQFVMPRLRHPEVLRTDRHRTLLEGLADGLAAGADDGIARAGAQVIHRELHRLTLLRTACNALVQG
jgi:hypothetical protein